MLNALPETAVAILDWSWSQIAPYYDELLDRPLTAENCAAWLADWSRLSKLINERYSRHYVANTIDTTDVEAEQRYRTYLEIIHPFYEQAEQKLKQKLLASGFEPEGMAIPLKKMRIETAIFREANVALEIKERELALDYNKILGAQTILWEGQERTLTQLKSAYQTPDRTIREQIWRQSSARQLEDRDKLNEVWVQLLTLRRQIAANANFDDYRAFRWQFLRRLDYSPADCETFLAAIEEVVVPVANRIYAQTAQNLGVPRLRPWDVEADVYPFSLPALRPFADMAELEAKGAAIFNRVDPELGHYFQLMRQENLLSLANTKGKGPGAYCINFLASQRPFIFMNAVGSDGDIKTLLHEAGHAFHDFETHRLPYVQQMHPGAEFAEVASMSMELLASPYVTQKEGGFYNETDAMRHRRDHLHRMILFWPYMAVVDGFQHWVYTHSQEALNPSACDAHWAELWQRFMPALDWQGFEAQMSTGWHRKLHIFRYPFYYVEYGLAQMGAIQVWRNALQDQAKAVAQYRQALSYGATRSLPELFAAAGARFAFDAATMRELIDLLEKTLAHLQG